jgi:hypothetical protein
VPDQIGFGRQGNADGFGGRVGGIKQTQFDFGGVLGEQGEVCAATIPIRTQRIGISRLCLH